MESYTNLTFFLIFIQLSQHVSAKTLPLSGVLKNIQKTDVGVGILKTKHSFQKKVNSENQLFILWQEVTYSCSCYNNLGFILLRLSLYDRWNLYS